MFVSTKRWVWLILIGCLIDAQAPAHAQDNIGSAEILLRAAYGDLLSEPIGLRVTAESSPSTDHPSFSRLPELVVQFERGRSPMPMSDGESSKSHLLDVIVDIDPFGYVSGLRAAGTYVHSDDVTNVISFARAHPKLSDDMLVNEIERRGARFTSDSGAVERAMNLSRFEPSLGLITKRQIQFHVRYTGSAPDMPDEFDFTWIARLQTSPAPGKSECYMLDFEPFEARLVRLNRLLRCP